MAFQLAAVTGMDAARMNKRIRFALIMVVSLFAASANGAPMAYSVNSDSGKISTDDSLYAIDLTTGSNQHKGKLFTGVEYRSDTEGLAFDSFGNLWGADDESLTLFQINTDNGIIPFQKDIQLPFKFFGSNDFGMTFTCDNALYLTSVIERTLYRLDLEGGMEIIGTAGALGANISAIAAIGNPTRLYGLGNGDVDTPSLYSIDVATGIATPIGTQGLGAEVGKYDEGGLAFDSDGTLWAITDRRQIENQPSQILRIDEKTGHATLINSTSEVGFESLAISRPTSCNIGLHEDNDDPRIPIFSPAGRLLAIFTLMLAGMLVLRRRIS
jgi:hypothetical protein